MAEFVCRVRDMNPNYLSACKNLPEYQETGYCVLHFPGEEKEDFEQVKKDKLEQEDYDFSGTVFPEGTSDFGGVEFHTDTHFTDAIFIGGAGFWDATFSGEGTYFDRAQFSSERTYFNNAQFSGRNTSFVGAQFSGEITSFVGAQFSGVGTYFLGAHFSGAQTAFWGAHFSGETYFRGAQFSSEGTYFNNAQFSGRHADFYEAQFSGRNTSFVGAQFSGEITSFVGAQFSGAQTSFREAHFSGETYFREAQFSSEGTYFNNAQFSGAQTSFEGAQFGSAETSFQEATFAKEVYFSGVTFSEKVTFWGTQGNRVFDPGAWAKFDRPRIEKPELLTFNTVLLHPGWFINADVRKVDFTEVKWYGMPGGPEGTLDEEIDSLKKQGVKAPHSLLAQACRRLSANAEDSREYPLANKFHYWSMDALRKESWDHLIWIREWISKSGLRVARRCGLAPTLRLVWSRIRRRRQSRPRSRFGLINTLYWALNGYGVRAGRAFLILVGISVVFAVLYMLLGPTELHNIGTAVVYSLGAMARLNPNPRPEPATDPALFQFLIIVEGILGPLQIALLALAVRRKVMR